MLGNLCKSVCKTSVLGNEELRPFIDTLKLILPFIQTIDIGLGQSFLSLGSRDFFLTKLLSGGEIKITIKE